MTFLREMNTRCQIKKEHALSLSLCCGPFAFMLLSLPFSSQPAGALFLCRRVNFSPVRERHGSQRQLSTACVMSALLRAAALSRIRRLFGLSTHLLWRRVHSEVCVCVCVCCQQSIRIPFKKGVLASSTAPFSSYVAYSPRIQCVGFCLFPRKYILAVVHVFGATTAVYCYALTF